MFVVHRSTEPVVSPLALAVSLQIDSSFVAALVPSLQLSVKFGRISCGLINHSNHSHSGMKKFYSIAQYITRSCFCCYGSRTQICGIRSGNYVLLIDWIEFS